MHFRGKVGAKKKKKKKKEGKVGPTRKHVKGNNMKSLTQKWTPE